MKSIITSDEDIDAQREFKDRLDDISKLVSSDIDISDILNTTSSVRGDYDSKLEEIINEINNRLKSKSNS